MPGVLQLTRPKDKMWENVQQFLCLNSICPLYSHEENGRGHLLEKGVFIRINTVISTSFSKYQSKEQVFKNVLTFRKVLYGEIPD